MGRVIRVSVPSGVKRQIVKQLNSAANFRVLAKATQVEVKKTVMPRISKQIAVHYSSMLGAIQVFLDSPGIASTGNSGVRQVTVLNAKGARVRVSTGSWQRLNPAYAASNPRSKTFWRKGSRKPDYVQLSELYRKATRGALAKRKPVVRAESFPIKKSGNIEMRFEVDLGNLPFPLGDIIGKSFVDAKKQQFASFSILGAGRRDITRIAFPERQRPVISALAARLGRDMRIDLRNG